MKRKLIFALLILTFVFSNVCYAYPETPNYEYTKFSSDSEELFQNVSMLSLTSTAMLVKGATRYIDDDDMSLTPTLVDARTYIPLKTAETLFWAYTEGDESDGKVDFRTGGSQKSSVSDTRLVLDNASATINGSEQEKNEYLIYIDGEAYMPLRKLGEITGNKVYYDNGYILIGKEANVNAILESEDGIAYGKNVLDKFIPSKESGKEIFVSPEGKDYFGDGSIDNPYKTIGRATKTAEAGDTIILREGTYRETIKTTTNGEPQKPIIYKAYKNEKVVVSALETVTGFTDDEEKDDPNFVKADLSKISGWENLGRGRNQVFYNNNAIVEARFPNVNPDDYGDDVSPFFPTKGDLKLDWSADGITWTLSSSKETQDQYGSTYRYDTYTSNSAYVTKKVEEWVLNYLGTPQNPWKSKTEYSGLYRVASDLLKNDGENDWVGATYVSLHGNAWNWGTAIVDSSKAGSFTVDPSSVSTRWWYSYTDYKDKTRNPINVGYLTNHKNAIDIPEEWNITDNMLYMYLPTGETTDTLNTGKIEVKARQLVCDLRNCKYIQIDGIDFIGGSLTADNSEMCVVKNCTFDNSSQFTYSNDQREGYIDATVSDPVNQKNNLSLKSGIPEKGEVGLYFGGTNDVIRDCTITETAGAGVYLTGAYTMVQNNYMLDCGYAGSTVGGIYIGSKGYGHRTDKRGGYVIKYNTVKNTARSSLTLQMTEGTGWAASGGNDHNAAFMPSDISYNEFVNGSLCGWDTGLVYLWGATMGSETDFTQLHHNLIYMTTAPSSTIHSCIYHDNFINNIETRDNVMFYTDSNLKFYSGSYEDVLVQPKTSFPNAWSEAVVHDNEYHAYKPGGLSSLTDEDYPDGIKFKAGVR